MTLHTICKPSHTSFPFNYKTIYKSLPCEFPNSYNHKQSYLPYAISIPISKFHPNFSFHVQINHSNFPFYLQINHSIPIIYIQFPLNKIHIFNHYITLQLQPLQPCSYKFHWYINISIHTFNPTYNKSYLHPNYFIINLINCKVQQASKQLWFTVHSIPKHDQSPRPMTTIIPMHCPATFP